MAFSRTVSQGGDWKPQGRRGSEAVSLYLMRGWFGASLGSPSLGRSGLCGFGGAAPSFLVRRCVLCHPHLGERELKAFLGSVHWKGLERVINNCLMDFSTLTSGHVASGRNLLLQYINKNATSLLTLVCLLRLYSFGLDSLSPDFCNAVVSRAQAWI